MATGTWLRDPITIGGQSSGYRRVYAPGYAVPALPPANVVRRTYAAAGGGIWTVDYFATANLDPLASTTAAFTKTAVRALAAAGTPAAYVATITESCFPSGAVRDAFFASCQADGGDIRAFADTDLTERLPLHVRAFDKTNKKILAHVRLEDALAQNADFFLRTGAGGVTPLAHPLYDEFFGARDVWQDFKVAIDFATLTDYGSEAADLRLTGASATDATDPLGFQARVFAGGNTGERIRTSYPKHDGSISHHMRFKSASSGDFYFFGKGFQHVRYQGSWRYGRLFTNGNIEWSHAGGGAPSGWTAAVVRQAGDLTAPTLTQNGTSYTMTGGSPSGAVTTNTERLTMAAQDNGLRSAAITWSLYALRAPAVSQAYAEAETSNMNAPASFFQAQAPASVDLPVVADDLPAAPARFNGKIRLPKEATMSGIPISFGTSADLAAHHALCPHLHDGVWSETPAAYTLKSGRWNDPATWSNGQVPSTFGKYVVMEGHRVVVDPPGIGTAASPVYMVCVEDRASFEIHQGDVKLHLHTLMGDHGALLSIGRAASDRFLGDFEQLFPTGLIDVAQDPRLLTKGVMWMGEIKIFGKAKTGSALSIAGGCPAGALTLSMASIPADWEAGDLIGIPAVDVRSNGDAMGYIFGTSDPGNDCEYRAIVAIDRVANTISWLAPLLYNHVPRTEFATPALWPGGFPWNGGTKNFRQLDILNLTRNVRFKSAQGGTSQSQVKERAHFMAMFTDRVEIRDAAFIDMGRSDKRFDGFLVSDHVGPDGSGPLKWRARYNAQTAYAVDDCVYQNVNVGGQAVLHWKCISPTTGNAPSNPTYWEAVTFANPPNPDVPEQGPLTPTSNILGRYALHIHCGGISRNAVKIDGLALYGMAGLGIVDHSSHAEISNIVSAKSFGAHYMAEAGDEKVTITNWRGMDHVNAHNDWGQKDGDNSHRHDWGRSNFMHLESREAKLTNVGFYGGSRAKPVVFHTRGNWKHNAYPGDWSPPDISGYFNFDENGPQPDVYHSTGSGSNRVLLDVHPLDIRAVFGVGTWGGFHVVKEQNIQGHDKLTHLREIVVLNSFLGHHVEYTRAYAWADLWALRTSIRDGSDQHGYTNKAMAGLDLGKEAMGQSVLRCHLEGWKYAVHVDADPAVALQAGESWQYFLGDIARTNCEQTYFWDATGTYAGRSAHDAKPSGFKYYSTDGDAGATTSVPSFFVRNAAYAGGWTPPVPVKEFSIAGTANFSTFSLAYNESIFSEASGTVVGLAGGKGLTGTVTNAFGAFTFPDGKEIRQPWREENIRGILRSIGFWQTPAARFFVEHTHYHGNLVDQTDKSATRRIYLEADPNGASRLASNQKPAYRFLGVKA